MGHSYPRRWEAKHGWRHLFRLRRFIIRICIVISVFAAGIVGVLLNSPYTLRIAFGSVGILALLRYRYVLLLAWVLITVVVSSNPIFTGTNFLTGLTVPTLLLMTCMPIKQTFKRMRALAFLLLFFLWMLAGIGISPLGIGTFVTTWIINLDFVAVGILTINTLTTEQRVKGLIDAILCASAFVALYGLYGYFTRQNGAPDPEVGFRIFSIFGSSPALGLFLSLGIPLALYRTLTLQGFKRIGCLLVMLVLLVALVMSLDRNAAISVALSLLIMAFFLPSRKMRIALLSSLLALAVLTVLLEQVSRLPIFYRFFLQDTTTLDGRTQLWEILLARFDPTQLLGHGLGASGTLLASLNVFNIQARGQSSLEAHNLFLAILYDNGVIGLTLLILVFITLSVSLIAGMRKTTGAHQMLFLTALAILASVFLQSFGATDIFSQNIGLYFWIIMALPFALYWSVSKQLTETREGVLDDDEAKIPRMPARQRKEREQISAV